MKHVYRPNFSIGGSKPSDNRDSNNSNDQEEVFLTPFIQSRDRAWLRRASYKHRHPDSEPLEEED